MEEGDRVDHRIFGFGTVDRVSVAVVRPDMRSPGGIRDAGWSIPVRWDDVKRTAGLVMHDALRKIETPDSRPLGYWDSLLATFAKRLASCAARGRGSRSWILSCPRVC